jgi:O-methyltransferase/methyltransferase family protein
MTVVADIDTATPVSPLNPEHILKIGMGFWASKTLLSAVELGLFTVLGGGGRTAPEIAEKLDLHERSRDDFLDALVSLGLLARDGDGTGAIYSNTPESALFLDQASPAYLGGILEMSSHRLYGFWGSLTEALHTGRPQSEIKTGAPSLFEGVYADPQGLEVFLAGMSGVQLGAFHALVRAVDFSDHSTFCDVGGADGTLAAILATAQPHLTGAVFDLPPVVPIAESKLSRAAVADRVTAVAGDFFTDELPPADVYIMGNVLHDWDEQQKQALIDKAYAGLPSGGMLIAIENVIDDARRVNTFGLLMSLNMLIELPGGFDYTGAQFDRWARTAGFARTEVRHLAGPTSAAIAYKD